MCSGALPQDIVHQRFVERVLGQGATAVVMEQTLDQIPEIKPSIDSKFEMLAAKEAKFLRGHSAEDLMKVFPLTCEARLEASPRCTRCICRLSCVELNQVPCHIVIALSSTLGAH